MNEPNLRKLAYGLWNQPEGMPEFGMGSYGESDYTPTCGTVGCAVGWGTHLVERKKACEEWDDYCVRLFIDYLKFDCEWCWCFDGEWADVDNTPLGAAKRILWLLQFGVPDDYLYQMAGEAPLCYADWEIVNESDLMDGSGLRLLPAAMPERVPEAQAATAKREVRRVRHGLHADSVGS